jgi:16S rRNA (guanine527-N7)-methyltransferase
MQPTRSDGRPWEVNRERAPLEIPPHEPLVPPPGFDAELRAIGAPLAADLVAKVGDYLGCLIAMNERMNLTAIDEPQAAWTRHALDALSLVPLLASVPPGASLIDIGSGGGLPGVPLAIARSDLRVTLVEATQKKAAFLGALGGTLGLANLSVHPERAERLNQGPLRGTFDVVTARAVARLSELVPLTLPFAKPGGLVLLIKGQQADVEVGEARAVIARAGAVHERTVATPTGRIVVLRRSG